MNRKSIFFWVSFSLFCFLTLSLAEAAGDPYEQMAGDLLRAMKNYREHDKPLPDYHVVFRRDPMRSLIDEQGRLTSGRGLYNGLAVQGLIRSKDLKLALVNDEFYKEGERVGPYKILEIQPNGLIVELEGKNSFIPFYPEAEESQQKTSPL